MGIKGGPDIITDGLVFNLDAAGAVSDKGYPINGLPIEYLIVAGGGAGGRHHGGGGGAGGLLHGYTKASLSTGSYTVVIGAGGAKNTGTNSSPGGTGGNGQNSSAFGLTSIGGGGGGQYNANGANGGSGGGPTNWSVSRLGGAGTAGQGHMAVNGSSSYNTRGGGGGAGGSPTSANNYNNGGVGKYFGYSFGRSLGEDGWFAGGGAAGTYGGVFCSGYARYTGANIGGIGGGAIGGYGCHGSAVHAANGQANTGGGGGGQPAYNRLGGNGGSGIVIIKYKGPQKATGGDSIITRKGFTIHVFTSSGTFTVGGRVGGLSTSKIVGTLENMGSSNYSNGNRGYFTFDGSNESIGISDFNVSDLGGNFTMCSFFKPVSAFSYIFSSKDASPSIQTYNIAWFRANNNVAGLNADTMWLQLGRASWHWQIYGSNGLTLALNNWHYVAVTATNLNTSSHTIKFYVNDQSVTGTKWTVISAAPINYGGSIQQSTFLSRAYTATSPSYNSAYTEANIAMFQIYNKALSANEVKQNYNATKGRFGL